MKRSAKDPDELSTNGIGSIFMGDGFFLVAVILSVTNSPVSSLLWLFLLIPAFFFFGKGFADLLHARQIQARLQREELKATSTASALPGSGAVEPIKKAISGELFPAPSVAEGTTRDLNR